VSSSVFTTHRKKPKTTINIFRKGSIIKTKCTQLTKAIVEMYPEDGIISDEDLLCLIQDNIGADKETIRAYKGYAGHIRAGRCGDNRIVGVSRKGYLEVMGFLRKIPGHRWAVCQAVLPSQVTSSEKVSESCGSNEKISISTPSENIVQNQLFSEPKKATDANCGNSLEKKEVIEKERNISPKIPPKNLQFTPEDDEGLLFLDRLADAGKKIVSTQNDLVKALHDGIK